MIRMGEQYRDSIRDGRQVWINGERGLQRLWALQEIVELVDARPGADLGRGKSAGRRGRSTWQQGADKGQLPSGSVQRTTTKFLAAEALVFRHSPRPGLKGESRRFETSGTGGNE
jgi:hypothetical protein